MRVSGSKKSQNGQILLLVVLASVIALTVGLAAISRTITNTRVSSEESNSQKALSAAEAGVEEQINKALAGNANDLTSKNLNNNSDFSAIGEPVPKPGVLIFEMNNGELISQDEGADIWLSDYPNFDNPKSTTLDIYWNAESGTNCNVNADPAIEIALVYGASKTDPSMDRFAFDSCNRSNNFDSPNAPLISGYTQGARINVSSGYIARVIPLYANAKIAVRSSVELPPQGFVIQSTGKSGNTVRKVEVYQGFPKLPVEFFPYNLFLPN